MILMELNMDSKKVKEIIDSKLDAISGGVASELMQQNIKIKENEKSAVMKDLLQGLSYGPSAPECTDATK
jgi:hypothetical protein